MRCEDFVAVIEDYFDGELEAGLAARAAAHLPACAGCAAALEALEAEQAVYLRYDRGLEVTPALWEGVRARIAAADESPAAAAPPAPSTLARLRAALDAAFAGLALRPALASSLALLVFGVAAGSLLFKSRNARPEAPGQQLAASGGEAPVTAAPAAPAERVETPAVARVETPATASPGPAGTAPAAEPGTGSTNGAGGVFLAASAPRAGRAGAGLPGAPPPGPTTLGTPPTVAGAGPAAGPPDPDHLEVAGGELQPLLRAAAFDVGEAAAGTARLLEPEEKAVARHVERSQMLLRSFRNTPAAERTEAELAYERELSRKLLEENVSLRAEAEAAGDNAARRVLESIQPFLLDIANMREDPSRQDVRSIKERMRKTEIVAALQVY